MPICIVGLGPGPKGYLTKQAEQALLNADCCYVQTAQHPAVESVKELGVEYQSLDALYEQAEDFDGLNKTMAEKVLEQANKKRVLFAVTGEASQGQSAVKAVVNLAEEKKMTVKILPGIGVAAAAMAEAGLCSENGIQTQYGAVDLLRVDCDKAQVICDLDDTMKASEAKIALMELYPEDWQVAIVKADAEKMSHVWCALYEMDRHSYDATSCVVVPALSFEKRTRYVYADLQRIVNILRAPDGCPWDAEQTHFSLKSAMLEEACEAIAAVDEGDTEHLCEELGDVLLQTAMHAEIAQEQMEFTAIDMISGICQKLIRRHPHVFGEVTVSGTGEVLQNWEEIKKTERGHEPTRYLLDGVGEGMPALIRAQKLQKKAKTVGFDWQTAAPAIQKVQEECQELIGAQEEGELRTEEEAGDLLFAAVNAVRLSGVHAETALMSACEKFVRRFTQMEKLAEETGQKLQGKTLEELDLLWEKVKRQERQ